MSAPRKPVVGLALGSGSARGWAHVGVIHALEQAGIRPDLVCGTSIGALVGAAYAAGELERLEQWMLGLGLKDVVASLRTGAEVWLCRGSTLDAVRASIAVHVLFAPKLREGSLLVDGGLVNPVPVTARVSRGAIRRCNQVRSARVPITNRLRPICFA